MTPAHKSLRPHPNASTYDRLIDLYVSRIEPDDEASDDSTTVGVIYFDNAVAQVAEEMSADAKRLSPKEVKFLNGCVGAITHTQRGHRKSKKKTTPKTAVEYFRTRPALERAWNKIAVEVEGGDTESATNDNEEE